VTDRCDFCDEPMRAKARICRHCGRSRDWSKPGLPWWVWLVVSFGIIWVGFKLAFRWLGML